MLFINKLCLFGAAASTLLFGGFKLQDREESVKAGQLILSATAVAALSDPLPAATGSAIPAAPAGTLAFFTPDFTFRSDKGHTVQLELKGVTDTRLLKSGRKGTGKTVPALPAGDEDLYTGPAAVFQKPKQHPDELARFIVSVIQAGYNPEISPAADPHSPYLPDLTGETERFIHPVYAIALHKCQTGIRLTGYLPLSLRLLHTGSSRLARGQLSRLQTV